MKTRVTTERMMKSISTEDNFLGVLLNHGRLRILLFAVLLAVMLFNQISLTPLSISDTDASTYIIVPMLMLPIFALFMLKEELVPQVGWKDLLLGLILFATFMLLGKYMVIQFGFLAFTYRIGWLLSPIAIASIATILFGFGNLRRFSFIAVYALFASPLLLLPIINFNSAFATLNSAAVYHIAKIFLPGLIYSAPVTLMLNTTSVTIGEACVGIGALIGLVMLLLPLSYLYEGTAKRKVEWIISGIALLMLFNLIRMSAIAVLWFSSGPSQQLLDIHSVAGQYMFYIVVAIMIIFAGKYGLKYPVLKPVKRGKKSSYSILPIIIAVLLAILYYFISLQLTNAQVISPLLISNSEVITFTPGSLVSLLGSVANLQNYSSQSLINQNGTSAEIYVNNVSRDVTSPLILLFGAPNQTIGSIFQGTTFIYKMNDLQDTAKVYELSYKNNYSFVYYKVVPYELKGAYYDLGMYAILTSYPYGQSPTCQSPMLLAREAFTNAIYLNFQNTTTVDNIDRAYCFISKVVK